MQATIECGFTLERIRDMISTSSHCFLVFKIFKTIFLKYKISATFLLVEIKTHTFTIHIG